MRTNVATHSLWRTRLNRREFLRGTTAVVGATMLGGATVACGGSSKIPTTPSPATTTTPAGPKAGGTLNLTVGAQLGDLNPHTLSNAGTAADTFVYDRLLNYDHINGKYELTTAQSVENPDPLTYIFKIRPTARFQGVAPVESRPVTSQDVVASWNAFVANPRAINKGYFSEFVDHYETPDAATLVVKLKKPNAWSLTTSGLAAYATVVLPKELIDKGLLDKAAVGSGAYLLDQYDPGSAISFKRRPDGWCIAGRPYIDEVVYKVITDTAARSAALKAKQIDTAAARDKLEADEYQSWGPDMKISRDLYYPAQLFMRADAPEGLFNDPRVREAVYNALDIQALIDKVELGEAELSGPVATVFSVYSLPVDELKKQFPHDIQRAKQLLSTAGWDSSREVELKYPSGAAGKTGIIAELVQSQLAAVGIKTKLVPQDTNNVWYAQTILKRDFQLTVTSSLLVAPAADSWLRSFTTQGMGAGSTMRWSDPEVDAAVQLQMAETDSEKQRNLVLDAQRTIIKKFPPMVNLYSPYVYTGYWSYYHPALNQGQLGTAGHYAWLDKQ